MEKGLVDTAEGDVVHRIREVKSLFRKVFHCQDGRRVISEIRRRTRLSPKSELEYAKQAGVQLVIDMIFDMAEIFGEETYE
jgi:hypothetical protein